MHDVGIGEDEPVAGEDEPGAGAAVTLIVPRAGFLDVDLDDCGADAFDGASDCGGVGVEESVVVEWRVAGRVLFEMMDFGI